MKCSQCGSTAFEEDHTRGDKVCAECGLVVEENEVQAFVEYVENAGGTAAALGNFVSLESKYRHSKCSCCSFSLLLFLSSYVFILS